MLKITYTSGVRDNHSRGSVADFLKSKIRDGSRLSIVSAYFTIYAYDALKEHLDKLDNLDFLFGEPSFVNRLDPTKTQKKEFVIEGSGLQLVNKLQQKRVSRECADWIERKVQIKTIKQSNLLHGKMYHVENAGVEDAILGSSNFTVRGLGLGTGDNNNIELNLIVDGNRDRAELKQWFDDVWQNDALVKDVKEEVLEYLRKLYENHTPEFIYYKTLYHLFEKFLGDVGKTDAELSKTSLFETEIWKSLFEFQKDGVKGAINKILQNNGCIIADSVGLGKTYEALAVLKYFELRNERVLVLCPKKLRENWTVYKSNDLLNPFVSDRFRYDVLSHTDLSRERGFSGDINLETLNWGNYDLVVIDESHNFRNNSTGKKDDEGNLVRPSRYHRLMTEIIQSGVRTKVLLLSATPVNNDLKDLRNQLLFLTEGNDQAFAESLGIVSLKETLATAQKVFFRWARKQATERKTSELLEKLGATFFKLLDELTIARSRKHIQKYYKASIVELGGFPLRLKPLSIYSEIDKFDRFPTYDKLNDEISGYRLSLFSPSRYIKDDFRTVYQATERDPFTQADREKFLIGMMKVNFLKRLESSVKSFEITMERTIAKIETLEKKIKDFQASPNSSASQDEIEIDVVDVIEEDELDEEADEESTLVGGKLKYKLGHLDLPAWLKELKKDKDQLRYLYNAARDVTPESDAKLDALKKLIKQKVLNPTVNKLGEQNKKVIVFTAFADTATYLYDSIFDWARKELNVNLALVAGGGQTRTTFGENSFLHILTNFSPRAKHRNKIPSMPKDSEIDLIIATDCISEGQNLQDCDYLINYDIHWNPVRIIQRFGRIDRIGSASETVQLINFWPTDDLNKYIDLKNRVESRMALVDISATFEDNVLQNEELEDIISEDLRYRDKQLLRLKDEVLDVEDLSDTISLTEFTLDDFRLELLKYIKTNEEALSAAPFGLYTVVPPSSEFKIIAPGVIFCFKQESRLRAESSDGKLTAQAAINPLFPYFLVYVLNDGNVRFGFSQPKQLLDIYRALCSGKAQAYSTLCHLFDDETNDGSDMRAYDNLLKRAVASLAATFRKRVSAGLQTGRGFVIPNEEDQMREDSELDLVTWLVIKKDE